MIAAGVLVALAQVAAGGHIGLVWAGVTSAYPEQPGQGPGGAVGAQLEADVLRYALFRLELSYVTKPVAYEYHGSQPLTFKCIRLPLLAGVQYPHSGRMRLHVLAGAGLDLLLTHPTGPSPPSAEPFGSSDLLLLAESGASFEVSDGRCLQVALRRTWGQKTMLPVVGTINTWQVTGAATFRIGRGRRGRTSGSS